MSTNTLEKRVGTMVARMTLREPFIAAVVAKLPRKFQEAGTAWTNGREIGFGSGFCDELDDGELFFVVAHEAMHVVLMHMWRRNGRNPKLWNVATDAVINRTLMNRGYIMPAGGVNIRWVTEDMSADEVYRKLMENPEEQDAGGWDGEGDIEDAPDQSDAADMEAAITTAARMARAAGDNSALVARILGGELSPSVSWTDVLRHVMTSASREDYTYRRFDRRMMPQGVYMPSLYSEALGGLVIGVDTSGSVSGAELNQIAGEISSIMEDCNPAWIEVVYCDSAVASTQRFEAGEPLALSPMGGGGTRFKPVFDYANALQDKVAALVYLTDLYGNLRECEEPEYPVVWAVTSDKTGVPFGVEARVRV